MTGRDLIIYILQNNLENELVFKDGKFIGFMTVEETAARLNVGPATIKTYVNEGYLDSIKIGDTYLIPVIGGSKWVR